MQQLARTLAIIVTLGALGCHGEQEPPRNPADEAEIDQLRSQTNSLEREIAGLMAALASLEERTAALSELSAGRGAQLDDLNRLAERYRAELEGLQALSRHSGDEAAALRQLAERRAQEIAELSRQITARTAIFEQLRTRLASLIDAGRLTIGFRRGFIVINLPNRILYRSGRAGLSDEGRTTIEAVGQAIAAIDDRRFLVAGHTDNVPIRLSDYESNWQLSSARAQAVLDVLVAANVPPQRLGTAGFGEHDPVATNDTAEGRAENRRTELLVMPDLEELYRSLQLARAR